MRRNLGLIALVGLLACGDDSEPAAGPKPGRDPSQPLVCNDEIETLEVKEYGHVQGPVKYPDLPPVGGNHNQCWTDWGVHETEAAEENWVHNLEHGGIAFLYSCVGGCPEERAELEGMVEGRPFALVTPYTALPTRFGVVAWGKRLLTDCFDRALFESFYDMYEHKGPEGSPVPPTPRPDVCK